MKVLAMAHKDAKDFPELVNVENTWEELFIVALRLETVVLVSYQPPPPLLPCGFIYFVGVFREVSEKDEREKFSHNCSTLLIF